MSEQDQKTAETVSDTTVTVSETQRAAAKPVPPGTEGYGRLYGPMAILAIALTFVPLFEKVVDEGDGSTSTFRYDSLWATTGHVYGSPAELGLMVIGVLVVLLLVATFRSPRGPGLPIAITLWTLLPLIMLTTKFGTGDPAPDLSAWGSMGLGVMITLLLVGTAHTIHLLAVRKS